MPWKGGFPSKCKCSVGESPDWPPLPVFCRRRTVAPECRYSTIWPPITAQPERLEPRPIAFDDLADVDQSVLAALVEKAEWSLLVTALIGRRGLDGAE